MDPKKPTRKPGEPGLVQADTVALDSAETVQSDAAATEDGRSVEALLERTGKSAGGSSSLFEVGAGARVGRFVVLDRIGGGGMGVVVAAYDGQLDRKVAIKVLAPAGRQSATGSDGTLRLIREAQAMAKLSHPNVVVVHEVGSIGDEVFVAMEYVDGGTLTSWLKEKKRSWSEIVRIFIQAGRGLAAAHEAGLIHRDFKPDNVMVGNDGRPRVTDFGLVATTGRVVDEEDLADELDRERLDALPMSVSLTRTGALLGTPLYMAPEQHRRQSVTAAADQFAFCVALYEALYEERPYAATSYRALADSVNEGSVQGPPRHTEVPTWIRAVLLRGLRPDPDQRYPTMAELIAALGRDPAATRRRRLRAAAGGALIGIAIGAIWLVGSVGATDKVCSGAERRLTGVWDRQVAAAAEKSFLATERSYAADVYARVDGILDDYAQDWATMRTEACEATRVRGDQSDRLMDLRMACLDRHASKLAALTGLFAGDVDADLVDKAVQAARALPSLRQCADTEVLGAAVPPPDDEATREQVAALEERLDQASSLEAAGKFGEAEKIAAEVVAEARLLGYQPLLAEGLFFHGTVQMESHTADAAEATFTEAAQVAAAARDDARMAGALVSLIHVRGAQQNRHAEALALQPAAEAAVTRAGGDPLLRARMLQFLGTTLREQGKPEPAQEHLARAVEIFRTQKGEHDLEVAGALDELGLVLVWQAKTGEARDHHERALEIRKAILGPVHPVVARSLYHVGSTLHDHAKYEEAREYYERAMAIDVGAFGPDHGNVGYELNALGELFAAQGKYDEAREKLERALEIWTRAFGPGDPRLAFPLLNLGTVLLEQGRYDEARTQYLRALGISEGALDPEHSDVAECFYNLGNLGFHEGKCAEASGYLQRAVTIYEKGLGGDHIYLAWPLTVIGQCHVAQGRPEQAIAPLERALAVREAEPGDKRELGRTRFALARALWESKGDRKRAVELAANARAAFTAAGVNAKRQLGEVNAWLARRAR